MLNEPIVTENDFMRIVGYIKCSKYRLKALIAIDRNQYSTPTEIAKNTGIRPNHISKVLAELKDKNLVVCINEEMRKGRLYTLTELGKDIIFHIKTNS